VSPSDDVPRPTLDSIGNATTELPSGGDGKAIKEQSALEQKPSDLNRKGFPGAVEM